VTKRNSGGAEPAASQSTAGVGDYAHGRVPRALRRQQILELAAELFVERGYGAASMDELGRRAGVTKPVIYALVGNKEAVFAEVVAGEARELSQQVEAAVRAEDDAERKLHAGALAFFRFAESRREAWAALLTPDTGPGNAELQAARRFHTTAVARLLSEGVELAGGEVDPLMTEACARAINGAFEALADYGRDHPSLQPEVLAALATQLLAPGLRDLSGLDGPRAAVDR